MDKGMRLAIEATRVTDRHGKQRGGTKAELARRIEVTEQAVGRWKRVPARRLMAVVKATGVPAYELRPDLFRGMVEQLRKLHGGSGGGDLAA